MPSELLTCPMCGTECEIVRVPYVVNRGPSTAAGSSAHYRPVDIHAQERAIVAKVLKWASNPSIRNKAQHGRMGNDELEIFDAARKVIDAQS